MNPGILSGLRVLDFTWVLAGPFATRILADFGAEVIKVQSPKTAQGVESNLTGYFNTWNRNKRSITLDMGHGEAKEIVLRLTRISDVVIENFSPRVMSNWGLSYENLKKVKPDLIMASISGMGQTGPWRDFVALAPTIHALSGLTYLTSFLPDSPIGVGFAHADFIAGLYAAFGVLAALEHRDRTGQGQFIDLSEYETMCSLLGPTFLDSGLHHKEILPQGNHPEYLQAAPYGCYPCSGKDKWCVIAVFSEAEWHALCKVLGHPSWIQEERFATLVQRKKHVGELDQRIRQWTTQHTREEVVTLFQEAGIPAGAVQDADDLAKDPQLKAREFFIPLEHPTLGPTIADRSPIRFKDNMARISWKAAPLLGEDNQYVFRELLGFGEDELSEYIKKGIIG
ncbi:MAG: CoA transferase [Deltaproteobacteria bacterium]|nr:CoA transferase [Deltaproteobacteria bacterium]